MGSGEGAACSVLQKHHSVRHGERTQRPGVGKGLGSRDTDGADSLRTG